jgi:hypothetical protein
MGIADQFGFFDLMAHVIPGVVLLTAWGWVVVDARGALPDLPSDLVVATVGFVLAYVLGQLCQLAADTGPGRVLVKGVEGARESAESRFLAKHAVPAVQPRSALPDGFPAALRWTMHERLGLRADAPARVEEPPQGWWPRTRALLRLFAGVDPAPDVEARQHCFRACYGFLVLEGNAARAQTFKAIASFHESMAIASLGVAAAGLVVVARHGLHPAPVALVLGALLALLLFRQGHQDFDKRFVKEVYHGFYAAARKGQPAVALASAPE